LRRSKKISEGSHGQTDPKDIEANDITMNMELDLVSADGSTSKGSDGMEAFLNLKTKKSGSKSNGGA